MKFSLKIFITSFCLFILALGIGSFYMLNSIYEEELSRVIEQAENDNKDMYTYAITMDTVGDVKAVEKSLKLFVNQTSISENNEVFVGDKKSIEEIVGKIDIGNNKLVSTIVNTNNGTYIQVISHIQDTYLMNRYNLSEVLAKRDNNFETYKSSIIIASIFMAIMLFGFSEYVARPITKLKKMAEKISNGDFSARIDTRNRKMKSYEVKKLGEAMNIMAENTSNTVEELEQMIKKREEFIGDFTHELKTPLTSIIGYGDMLRSFDLPTERRREYGDYIYKEGKRLENMSLILLQMIVMDNDEIELSEIKLRDVMLHVYENAKFMEKKYGVAIEFNVQDGVIMAEYSLVTTMILNFIDNACKASDKGKTVSVIGRRMQDAYCIKIVDKGKGISKDDIEKIMEPFYMVDKSRSRSQGGAGLGLALCKKIADIMDVDISIESEIGVGTTVTALIKA